MTFDHVVCTAWSPETSPVFICLWLLIVIIPCIHLGECHMLSRKSSPRFILSVGTGCLGWCFGVVGTSSCIDCYDFKAPMQTFSQLLSIFDWIQEHHKPPWSSTLLENTAAKVSNYPNSSQLQNCLVPNRSTSRLKEPRNLLLLLPLLLPFPLPLGASSSYLPWSKWLTGPNVKQSIEMSYFKQLISWYLSVLMHNIEISGICTVGNCTKHVKFRWKGVVKTCWHFLSKTYRFLVESMKTLEMSTSWRGFHNWYYNKFWLKISGIFKKDMYFIWIIIYYILYWFTYPVEVWAVSNLATSGNGRHHKNLKSMTLIQCSSESSPGITSTKTFHTPSPQGRRLTLGALSTFGSFRAAFALSCQRVWLVWIDLGHVSTPPKQPNMPAGSHHLIQAHSRPILQPLPLPFSSDLPLPWLSGPNYPLATKTTQVFSRCILPVRNIADHTRAQW